MADAKKVAIRIDDGELFHAPRLVFDGIHPRNAARRQCGRRERCVKRLDIGHPDVAPRVGLRRR